MKRKLGEICRIISGSTPKTGIPEYWDGNLKWITPAELDDESRAISDTKRTITELGAIKTGLTPLPAGTVLLSSRAPIGKVAITGCEMYCNQGFKNLICSDSINNKYLYWFLKGKTQYLNSLGRGATFKEISKKIVADIEINLPDIEEQEKIVNRIEKIDNRLFMLRAEISRLDELIKARFVEMFGNYKMEKTIGEVATICRGASPRPISKFITESNGENWIKIGDVKENDIYITKTKELVTEDGANRSRRIKPGDFILSNSMSFGRPYISKIYGCVHDGWLIVSDYEQSFLPLFFYYAIRSELVQAQFRRSVAGAVVKNLNSDLVRSVKIVIPSIESQEKFSSFVAQVDKSKFTIQKSLEKTQLLFDSLMQEYFG